MNLPNVAFNSPLRADIIEDVEGVITPKEQEVAGCSLPFVPDHLEGFEYVQLSLPEEDDGKLCATLVRTVGPEIDEREAVLYVHGFIDYFFQTHVAAAFEEAGVRFYALDLRRYGRSLNPGNRAFMAWNIQDYFAELDWAVETIRARHPSIKAIFAHSTGGLVTSLYLAHCLKTRGARLPAQRLILNSPFLRFNLGQKDLIATWLVARLARLAPATLLPQKLRSSYGASIHRSGHGEWDYNLTWKPHGAVPLYAGWFRMIRDAHAEVERGLHLPLPILCMHSDKSHWSSGVFQESDAQEDIVLNVEHIKSLSPLLGSNVTLFEVPSGIHDLTLSRQEVRDLCLARAVQFLNAKVD